MAQGLNPSMKTWLKRWVLGGAIALLVLFSWMPPASAGVNDDRYEGNIFPLYAGNGYLVPPRVTLKQSFDRKTPTVLVFYIDDSRDCKKFAPVLSSVDAFYGRVVNIIPIDADAIPVKDNYDRTEPGYYYKGFVPQTLVLDQAGDVVLDKVGDIPYENVDDVLRVVFDLLPRDESIELKRREVNELNTELVPADQA
ncbi:MAG: thylakoid membrane photosystem I accumulation factor [Cyanobacteria bacterium J06638_22]